MLTNKREGLVIKHCNDFKGFIKYSSDMDDIDENIEEYNLNKECIILIVFDDMIVDVLSNKKFQQILTELFGGRKLKIFLVFITQSYFAVPKNRLNSTHYFVMKIPNKRELQQVTLNHSSEIDFNDFKIWI